MKGLKLLEKKLIKFNAKPHLGKMFAFEPKDI